MLLEIQLMININLCLDLLLLAGDIEEIPGPGNMVLGAELDAEMLENVQMFSCDQALCELTTGDLP